jgi:hypothetical protein
MDVITDSIAEGKKVRAWDGLRALTVMVRDRLLPSSTIPRNEEDISSSS